jgi:chemotaxis protein histidine kinase CheA
MDVKQQRALTLRETDVQGALRRFSGNEDLYVSCLGMFLSDPTMEELNTAIDQQSWDEAFTAAHALKGLAGNMGFVPLMHATGQLVVLIRGGRIKDINDCMAQINSSYRDISDAIRDNFTQDEMGGDVS